VKEESKIAPKILLRQEISLEFSYSSFAQV